MTTLYSHQHHHPPTPVLDQPTPQSPFYMSSNHAPSNNYSPDKYNNSSGVSPPNSSITSSFSGSGSRPAHPANAIPTPASSAANTVPATMEDNDVDIMDEGSDTLSNKRRRTSSSSYDRTSQTKAPALRHRGNLSDGISPAMPTERELLCQPDVSPYYLVCTNPRQPSYPDLTDNLLARYGLTEIANSVARKNPTTGAKNKLRKSYKGFIGDLAGKHVVVTKASQTEIEPGGETGDGGGGNDYFATLLAYPEEEWHNLQVNGKDMSKPIDMVKLRKGLSMARGDIPGFDPSILGLDEESQRRKTPYIAPTPPAVGTAIGTPSYANGSTSGVPSPAGGDEARPKRKKRRRYDDASYEGYNDEGDDDHAVNGNNGSVGGGGGGGGSHLGPGGPAGGPGAIVGNAAWDGEKRKKKRKKNPDINSPGTGGGNMIPHHHAHGGIAVHGGGGYSR